ncbi:HAMP domain-containing sensor histidine kinase [Pseudodesulfovibrio sp. zrk46]|uniref:sensor histidine kinase n=1 Tax=Pseudodesulfovibrio sp. zrk46 TaxID=2725288 RepID=UPI001FFDE490|nr:HAMP domain-containing sensor histidine kinase [Pseudodesulfovibrio sp. zrk46]
MNKLIRFILTLLAVLLLSGASFARAEVKNVLLLNSYDLDIDWTASITKGVEETLDGFNGKYKLFIEFMDTKNHFSPEYLELLNQKYKLKYGDTKLAAVITSDDNAVNFAMEHRHELFNGAPIIFCGVNNLGLAEQENFKNITGVFEAPDMAATIRSAIDLQPGLKTIYFVIDDTTTGRIMRARSQDMVNKFQGEVDITWLDNMSMEWMQKTLAGLPKDSAAFLATFTKDADGVSYTFSESITKLYSTSNVPIYGVWDFYLGEGIVGGKLASGRYQGEMAASMAVDVVEGKSIDLIPVMLQKSNRYMFDYNVMEKFGLSQSNLPEQAIIINVPQSIYDTYAFEAWTLTIVAVVLSVMVIILLVNNRARRFAEKELEDLNNYQETIIESRTEELMHRSRELEMANYELRKVDELKTAVLNTVSHDLRTPLTAVLGFCKLIDRDFTKYFLPFSKEKGLDKKGRRISDNLNIIEQEGERLTRLVSDFLDLSKIESGGIAWNDVAVDPVKMLTQAAPILEGYFTDSPVSFRLEMKTDLPKVVADPDRILQVLNNLVGNAAKFTHEGEVVIKADTTESGWLRVSVKDTGRGIPADELESVFDKFYQVAKAESDLKQVTRGSGMGLAISKKIIEHYNGSIRAESVVNQGSIFTFTMPAAGE